MTNAQIIQLFINSAHQAWMTEVQTQRQKIRERSSKLRSQQPAKVEASSEPLTICDRSVALAAKGDSGARSNCLKKKG